MLIVGVTVEVDSPRFFLLGERSTEVSAGEHFLFSPAPAEGDALTFPEVKAFRRSAVENFISPQNTKRESC